MAFDPTKYGAVRVDETTSPTGKFDPTKYGAVKVEETLTPKQTLEQDKGLLEKASDISEKTFGKASSLFSGTGKFAGGALLNITNLVASKMKPIKEMTESDRALTEIDTKAVQKAHELALKGDKEGAQKLLKVVQSHGTNITLNDILPETGQEKIKDIVGAGAQTFLEQASFAKGSGLPGVSKVTQPISSALSKVTQPIKTVAPKTFGAIKGATQAGGYAGLFGASEGLQQEGATASSVAGSALEYATNPLVLATGGVLGGIAGRMSPEASKLRLSKNLSKVENEIAEIERGYSKTRPLVDKNVNARKMIAQSDALVGAVDETGTISTKTKGGAIDKFREQTIDGAEGIVRTGLQNEGIAISPDIVKEQLKKSILNSKLEGAELKRALNKIDDEVDGLALKSNSEGNIKLENLQDAKIFTTGNIDYTKPTSKLEAKAFANAYKELIEKNSKLNIGDVNKELAKYYEAIDLLETLDGKKVKGGKLGKYAARIGGQIAGSAVGGAVGGYPGMAVGTVAGGELSAKIQGMMMSKTFGKGVGQGLKKSPILEKAQQEFPQARKLLPERASVKETPIILPQRMTPVQGQVKSPSDLRTLPAKKTYKTAIEALQSPEMKAKYAEIKKMQQSGKVTKTSNNLYHTTSAENLQSIAEKGLTTGNKARFEGVSSPNKISFGANEKTASYYGKNGDVMIRTKSSYKPDDLELDLLAGGAGTYTTGKNIPPEMLEIKVGKKWIPLKEYKPLPTKKSTLKQDALIQEAKKYKTVEEFVKAQPKLYHGGAANIKEVKTGKSNFQKTFYMSENAEYAKSYGGSKSAINEIMLDEKAKLADLRNPDDKLISEIEQIISPKNTGKTIRIQKPDGTFLDVPEVKGGMSNAVHSTDEIIRGIRQGKAYFAEMPEVKKALKKLGYDGMITQESKYGANYGVWNKDVLKTKSQLTDIWNKANKLPKKKN